MKRSVIKNRILCDYDYQRILHWISSDSYPFTEDIITMVESADTVPLHRLPKSAVCLDSVVSFLHESTGKAQQVTIVHPAEADVAAMQVSVLSPLGSALIGARAGEQVTCNPGNGRSLQITIRQVRQLHRNVLDGQARRGKAAAGQTTRL